MLNFLKQRWVDIVFILAIIGLIISNVYYYNKSKQVNTVIEQVDSINKQIDTIYIKNDSLLNVVKESKSIVNTIDNEYKKNYIRIVNEPTSDDWKFFTEYLKKQELRGLFNHNYTDSIKEN